MADSDRMSPEEAQKLTPYDPDPTAHVRMRSVKLFTDGALGSWGAALLAPYADKPDKTGIMRFPEDELSRIVRGWWDRHFGVVDISADWRYVKCPLTMRLLCRIFMRSVTAPTKQRWTP